MYGVCVGCVCACVVCVSGVCGVCVCYGVYAFFVCGVAFLRCVCWYFVFVLCVWCGVCVIVCVRVIMCVRVRDCVCVCVSV